MIYSSKPSQSATRIIKTMIARASSIHMIIPFQMMSLHTKTTGVQQNGV